MRGFCSRAAASLLSVSVSFCVSVSVVACDCLRGFGSNARGSHCSAKRARKPQSETVVVCAYVSERVSVDVSVFASVVVSVDVCVCVGVEKYASDRVKHGTDAETEAGALCECACVCSAADGEGEAEAETEGNTHAESGNV